MGVRLPKSATRLFFALVVTIGLKAAEAKPPAEATAKRDPNQVSFLVGDFDGTLAHNVGNYHLRRVSQTEAVTPFFRGVNLPPEILVPVHDFEGNIGPQIGKRLGHIDERGLFVPSTSLEAITLSNGKTVVPGYYYLDRQYSYLEFRDGGDGLNHLQSAIEDKIEENERFLLDAFPFLSLAMSKTYESRLAAAILTLRGHHPQEMKQTFAFLQKRLKLGSKEWPEEAFVNLTHPEFFEFGSSKVRYLDKAFHELAERPMQDFTTPHYLVMFENDRKLLREIDNLFERLSNRGLFGSPVVPVLVNLVEPEVFAQPDGFSWDDSPMKKLTKMSRVTVYWPGKIERSDNLSRVYELVLQIAPEEAMQRWKKSRKGRFQCVTGIVEEGAK